MSQDPMWKADAQTVIEGMESYLVRVKEELEKPKADIEVVIGWIQHAIEAGSEHSSIGLRACQTCDEEVDEESWFECEDGEGYFCDDCWTHHLELGCEACHQTFNIGE